MALKSALPDTALLCNGLLEAEVQDLITITQVFACMEQVQKVSSLFNPSLGCLWYI